jgi:hypothetical protein
MIKPLEERENAEGNGTFDMEAWWKSQRSDLRAWASALRAMLYNVPNSCPPERAFSILNGCIDDGQYNAFADYKEAIHFLKDARVGSKTSGRPVVVGDAHKKFIAKQVEKARSHKPRPFVANVSIIQAAMIKSTDLAITEIPSAPHTDRPHEAKRQGIKTSVLVYDRATAHTTKETQVFSPMGPGPRRAPARLARPRRRRPWRHGGKRWTRRFSRPLTAACCATRTAFWSSRAAASTTSRAWPSLRNL